MSNYLETLERFADEQRDAIREALAEVGRLKLFVDLLVNNDADEREEILNNPKFWAEDYAHAMNKLAEVMGIQEERDELRAKVQQSNNSLDKWEAEVERLSRHLRQSQETERAALEEVERLKGENETLQQARAELGEAQKNLWARIEAALAKSSHTLDETCAGCRDLSGVIRDMVKALKGE